VDVAGVAAEVGVAGAGVGAHVAEAVARAENTVVEAGRHGAARGAA
jgi:hypothetical protein